MSNSSSAETSETYETTEESSQSRTESQDESDSDSEFFSETRTKSSKQTSSFSETEYEPTTESNSESEEEYETDASIDESEDTPETILGINQPTLAASASPLKFLVKLRGKSYGSSVWLTEGELASTRRGFFLYRQFGQKRGPFRQFPGFHSIFASSQHRQQELYKRDDVDLDEGMVTAEKVISKRNRFGCEEFLVKWASLGIVSSTWESANIPRDLVDDYELRNASTHAACFSNSKGDEKKAGSASQQIESQSFKNGNRLADYQQQGLRWLMICWMKHQNSILADEMGLGKTIESIAVLESLSRVYEKWGPFLVVCPLSTSANWLCELEKWTNFRVVFLAGDKASREMVKESQIFHYDAESDRHDQGRVIFDVLVTTYEMINIELSFIKKFKFMYAIFDEAHRLKNFDSQIYKNCELIRSYHILLMTGTPIQNDLYEIWSLLHFISPAKFHDFTSFEEKYRDKENPEVICELQKVLQPYILRRKKNDVNLKLPEKVETIIEVEMTQIQRTFSQIFFKDSIDILSDSKSNLRNVMMNQRKLFCHPYLFPELEDFSISEYKETHHISYSTPLTREQEVESLVMASGKTILIDKLLPKLKSGKHKVLIFSQFTSMLDVLEEYLESKNYVYERLDGSVSGPSRSASIDRFQNDDEVFVFLLSTRAGGLGINLTHADTVIIYDSDWNPQNDIQAQSRSHRIGQQNTVNVYRLITRGSYESEMFQRASKKLALDFAILDSGTNENSDVNKQKKSASETREELELILRKGAYYTFNDDPNEIDKFRSENIDQILENRSHTRVDVVSGGNSKFSKITFDGINDEENVMRKGFWESLIDTQSIVSNSEKNPKLSGGIRTRTKKKINYADTPYKPQKTDENKDKDKDEDEDENEDSNNKSSKKEKAKKKKESKSDNDSVTLPTLLPNKLLAFQDFSTFNKSIDQKFYHKSLSVLLKHGIGASRLFLSEFNYELCKSLICIVYIRLSKWMQTVHFHYIRRFIPDIEKQLYKTPYKEIINQEFHETLFKRNEKRIIKKARNIDVLYIAAIYISNNKLPENFQFIPEMDPFVGWSPIDDFTAITSAPFLNDLKDIINDEKLPFKQMNDEYPQMKNWIIKRVELNIKEISVLIPQTFSIYESEDNSKQKNFVDTKTFSILNHHVIHPKKLNRFMQKKLLRLIYLYGIPLNDAVHKIKLILRIEHISDETILIFIAKIIIRGMKYNPDLSKVLLNLCNINSLNINDNNIVDIRWIKEEAIQAVADNLYLIFRVRKNLDFFITSTSDPSNHLISDNLDEWKEIKSKFAFWNFYYDVLLFKTVAYYGFLFNSVLCKYIAPKLSDEDMNKWREKEIISLTPFIHPILILNKLEPIFIFEAKKNRISQILNVIKSVQTERK